MQKFSRIALAISLSLGLSYNRQLMLKPTPEELPNFAPESQHTTASKRITAQFTRAHYKQIKVDDVVFQNKYLTAISSNLTTIANVFLASDVQVLKNTAIKFDTMYCSRQTRCCLRYL